MGCLESVSEYATNLTLPAFYTEKREALKIQCPRQGMISLWALVWMVYLPSGVTREAATDSLPLPSLYNSLSIREHIYFSVS